MSRTGILAVLALGLLAGGTTPPRAALASSEIASAERLDCVTCHHKRGGKKLTDKGKYYELMRSMEGVELIEERFGKCTTCHVKKAGSEKLTREGERYRWMMQDMAGIRDWLMSRHPKPPVMDPPPGESVAPERRGGRG